MKNQMSGLGRWTLAACAVAALAACGGGGGGSAAPTPDVRNGVYRMVAADAQQYDLTLDFDASTYKVSGNGTEQSGSFTAANGAFQFQPGNGTGATPASTTRFSYTSETVVGEYALPGGAVPFVASRSFDTALPAAALTFNVLGRVVDTAGGANNTLIQQVQVTSDGRVLTCGAVAITTIAACLPADLNTYTVTVANDVFTTVTPAGNFTFRLANVGGEKILLRASVSSGTTRQFWIGTPATTTFNGGTFAGATTEPAYGTATLSTTAFSTASTLPDGTASARNGAGNAIGGPGTTTASLMLYNTAAFGNYFAIASSQIGVLAAARNNPVAPGFFAIGVRQ